MEKFGKGLMLSLSFGEDEDFITEKNNKENMQRAIDEWNLGPTKASAKPGANKPFWSGIAKVWGIKEDEARRRFCANCEYFDNTPDMLADLEVIKFNEFDSDGGGRGYCHKLEFICHNLRTCQAWEEKEYEEE